MRLFFQFEMQHTQEIRYLRATGYVGSLFIVPDDTCIDREDSSTYLKFRYVPQDQKNP